jgi:hypothetical protein
MADVRFPEKREDGSFTVAARFAVSDAGGIAPLVRDYVAAWTQANRSWTRIWRADVVREEYLEFSADFSTDPFVEAGAGATMLAILLEGKPMAHHWKDWAVRLVDDLSKVFPELQFERFESRSGKADAATKGSSS